MPVRAEPASSIRCYAALQTCYACGLERGMDRIVTAIILGCIVLLGVALLAAALY